MIDRCGICLLNHGYSFSFDIRHIISFRCEAGHTVNLLHGVYVIWLNDEWYQSLRSGVGTAQLNDDEPCPTFQVNTTKVLEALRG